MLRTALRGRDEAAQRTPYAAPNREPLCVCQLGAPAGFVRCTTAHDGTTR